MIQDYSIITIPSLHFTRTIFLQVTVHLRSLSEIVEISVLLAGTFLISPESKVLASEACKIFAWTINECCNIGLFRFCQAFL